VRIEDGVVVRLCDDEPVAPVAPASRSRDTFAADLEKLGPAPIERTPDPVRPSP